MGSEPGQFRRADLAHSLLFGGFADRRAFYPLASCKLLERLLYRLVRCIRPEDSAVGLDGLLCSPEIFFGDKQAFHEILLHGTSQDSGYYYRRYQYYKAFKPGTHVKGVITLVRFIKLLALAWTS